MIHTGQRLADAGTRATGRTGPCWLEMKQTNETKPTGTAAPSHPTCGKRRTVEGRGIAGMSLDPRGHGELGLPHLDAGARAAGAGEGREGQLGSAVSEQLCVVQRDEIPSGLGCGGAGLLSWVRGLHGSATPRGAPAWGTVRRCEPASTRRTPRITASWRQMACISETVADQLGCGGGTGRRRRVRTARRGSHPAECS